MATKTPDLTPALLAEALGTDARTTRKFLRSITPKDAQPGKGSRWVIPGNKKNLTTLGKQFADFTAAENERRAKDTVGDRVGIDPAETPAGTAPDDDHSDPTLDDIADPTDEEMLADSDD